MRPLYIDFLGEGQGRVGSSTRTRRLWLGVVLLLLVEMALVLAWRVDKRRLEQQLLELAHEEQAADRVRNGAAAIDQAKAAQAWAAATSFDPLALVSIEQAVMRLRNKAPEARLQIESLSFDGRQRRIVLQGAALQHLAVSQLRDEILTLMPQATAGFPAVHNGAAEGRPMQFELGIRLPAIAGGER